MNWNKVEWTPPLGKVAKERGNTDGGFSIPMLLKHQSGAISFGKALLMEGKVHCWFADDEFGADVHTPYKAEKDPVVEWMECPSPSVVLEALTDAGYIEKE